MWLWKDNLFDKLLLNLQINDNDLLKHYNYHFKSNFIIKTQTKWYMKKCI
jgi:hypothetical protein